MRALLLATLVVTACTDDGPVEVRVCNRTGHDLTMVKASQFASQDLAVDTCTSYATAQDDAYRYTGATFSVGNDRFDRQPIDFVGEAPLSPGRWSYELRIVDYATRTITTNAVED